MVDGYNSEVTVSFNIIFEINQRYRLTLVRSIFYDSLKWVFLILGQQILQRSICQHQLTIQLNSGEQKTTWLENTLYAKLSVWFIENVVITLLFIRGAL